MTCRMEEAEMFAQAAIEERRNGVGKGMANPGIGCMCGSNGGCMGFLGGGGFHRGPTWAGSRLVSDLLALPQSPDRAFPQSQSTIFIM